MKQEREEREQRHVGCSDRIYISQVRFPARKQRLAGAFIHADYIVITHVGHELLPLVPPRPDSVAPSLEQHCHSVVGPSPAEDQKLQVHSSSSWPSVICDFVWST